MHSLQHTDEPCGLGCDDCGVVNEDPSVTSFNVGINAGESAGQTVFHCHMHLMSKRAGDVKDPKGGVRGVIAAKRLY